MGTDSSFISDSEEFRRTLELLFEKLDIDSDGKLTAEEFNNLLNEEVFVEILTTFDIRGDMPRNLLMTYFGYDDNKEGLPFEDFYQACLRICGSNSDLRAFMLQLDIATLRQNLSRSVNRFQARVD